MTMIIKYYFYIPHDGQSIKADGNIGQQAFIHFLLSWDHCAAMLCVWGLWAAVKGAINDLSDLYLDVAIDGCMNIR